jgi:hypothetical protein
VHARRQDWCVWLLSGVREGLQICGASNHGLRRGLMDPMSLLLAPQRAMFCVTSNY